MKKIIKRIKALYEFKIGSEVCSVYPRLINVEPTAHCNLDCIMCPNSKLKRSKGYMEFELFKSIIEQSKDKSEHICLQLFGEPFLHRDIFKMIQYTKNAGLSVSISTNATLINKENALLLLESAPDLIILSIDASTKEQYSSIRKGYNYDILNNNIMELLKLKKEHNEFKSPIVIQCIDFNNNNEDLNKLRERFREYPVDNYFQKHLTDWGKTKTDARPKPLIPCIRLYRELAIYWNGDTVACCNDYDGEYILGNAKEESIADIWNGKIMQEMRRLHLSSCREKISLCRECTYSSKWSKKIIKESLIDYSKIYINKFLKRDYA